MTAQEIIAEYQRIEYHTTLGWQKLKDAFPIIMKVANDDQSVYLDNGNEMGSGSNFTTARIIAGRLFLAWDGRNFHPANQIRIP